MSDETKEQKAKPGKKEKSGEPSNNELTQRESLTTQLLDWGGKGFSKFAEKASPADTLKLLELYKEMREVEKKAELASLTIEENRRLANRAMDLREKLLDSVIAKMGKNDQALSALIERLEGADSPEEVKTTAEAIATVATSNDLSGAGEVMNAIRAGQIKLEF